MTGKSGQSDADMLQPERWLWRPLARPGARLLLLCFPHAGGGPSAFRRWAELLPVGVELLAVRLPGRQTRISERPYDDWDELLHSLGRVVSAVVDRPFALFGHSLGAMMAYELTRRLAASSHTTPHRLLLAACRAPDVPLLLPAIHRLPDEEFTRNLSQVASTPPEVLADRRMMRFVRPLMRADLTLAETWPPVAPTPVHVPATAFAGRDDTVAPPWSARRWSCFVGPFTIHVLAGDHFFVHSGDGAFRELLAAELTAALTEVG
ncbi:MAG: alpha/beta fold hydrolase [Pseudonocardiaceae bacterium]|jgi:surfactin synthase thioesterase subunit|nr:alpha/beta fold hydrolase [Pseudonocardiaceae bacterium]